MQDRLKFRVFDNDDKKMHDVIFLNYENNSVEWYNDNNKKRAAFIGEVPIVQCTGLEDINGKLIYEGDIIKSVNSNSTNLVEWFEGDAGFGCSYEEEVIQLLYTSYMEEVIGNIYENPELLKE